VSGADAERAAFKDAARESWSSVADAWRRLWPTFEAAAQPLNERLCDLARLAPGDRVLDVATGIGEPALTAARRVGAAGSVLGADLAPRMVALARERAADLGIANARFVEADAEALELEAASFDAAVSRWGLMLMADAPSALARVRAALRPGARLAAAVWSAPERVPMLRLPLTVAVEALGLERPDPDAPGPFRLAGEGRLAALLAGAGLEVELVEPFPVRFAYPSARDYAESVLELSGGLRRALAAASDTERARVRAREELERAVREHATADGRIELENEVLCAAARR
jgi:enediyne biosynthesis protein CalE5